MAVMTIVSSAFHHGGLLPQKYTADGANVSPPLRWRGVPGMPPFFVLVLLGGEKPRVPSVHWLLYDIQSFVDSVMEGEVSGPYVVGLNDTHAATYAGPSAKDPTEYEFRLFAVNTTMGARPLAWPEVEARMQGHVFGVATLKVTYPASAVTLKKIPHG